ncbi:MAG TPA: RNA 2',3'-cyclic phosphodiesterase [Thermoplasmata archaeon]|nr:RNA 2',3'-cyclic phosphodiesterase [Thermoplasmata archaeon]
MRAIVALEIPSFATDRSSGDAPEHLTLRFLGEISPDRAPILADRLGAIAGQHPPFDLTIEGVGAFPSRASPRIVWRGVTTGREPLVKLAEDVRRGLAGEGTVPAPDGPFVPHVTWFRVRSPADRRTAIDLLDGRLAAPPPRSLRVDTVVLKESVLAREGAVHRTLSAVRLGTAPPTSRSDPARSATSALHR